MTARDYLGIEGVAHVPMGNRHDMMRTEEPRPVRLSEYRPPDWLVETVDLDVKLHPTQTPVRATLKLKPNPAAGAPAPLHARRRRADAGLAQDRRRAARQRTATSRRRTASPSRSRRTGRSRSRSRRWSIRTANTQLSGLYRSSGTYCTQCEAEGFRRITYFPTGPT